MASRPRIHALPNDRARRRHGRHRSPSAAAWSWARCRAAWIFGDVGRGHPGPKARLWARARSLGAAGLDRAWRSRVTARPVPGWPRRCAGPGAGGGLASARHRLPLWPQARSWEPRHRLAGEAWRSRGSRRHGRDGRRAAKTAPRSFPHAAETPRGRKRGGSQQRRAPANRKPSSPAAARVMARNDPSARSAFAASVSPHRWGDLASPAGANPGAAPCALAGRRRCATIGRSRRRRPWQGGARRLKRATAVAGSGPDRGRRYAG